MVEDAVLDLRTPQLGRRRISGSQFTARMGQHALVYVRLCDLCVCHEVGQDEFDVLEASDRGAESAALLDVRNRFVENLPCVREIGDGSTKPFLGESAHRVDEPLIEGADNVVVPDEDVVEE